MAPMRLIQKAMPREADLACVGCGYDLQGLEPHGDCPECGTPIARTLGGNPLSDADPRWLRRLLWGVRLISLTPPVLMLLALLAVGMVTQPIGCIVLGLVTGGLGIIAGVGMVMLGANEIGRTTSPPLQRPAPYAGGVIVLSSVLLIGTSPLKPQLAAYGAAGLAVGMVLLWIYAVGLLMPIGKRAGAFELNHHTAGFLIYAAIMLGLPTMVGLTIGIPMLGPSVSTLAVASSLLWVAGFVIMCQWAAVLLFRYVSLLDDVLAKQRAPADEPSVG